MWAQSDPGTWYCITHVRKHSWNTTARDITADGRQTLSRKKPRRNMNATTCWKEMGKTTPHKIRSRPDADRSAQVWFDTPLVTTAHSCERLGPRYLVTSEKWSADVNASLYSILWPDMCHTFILSRIILITLIMVLWPFHFLISNYIPEFPLKWFQCILLEFFLPSLQPLSQHLSIVQPGWWSLNLQSRFCLYIINKHNSI